MMDMIQEANQSHKPSKYEKTAIIQIHEWKHPNLGWFGQAMELINWPLNKAGELITEVPGVDWVIEKSIGGMINLLNDFAQWSVSPQAIYKEYHKAGFKHVKKPQDIFSLDLEDIDKTIGWLGMMYKSMAVVEGGAAGYIGVAGIPADVIALISLNLRAIGEYATYCGFDISSQEERLFALNVLGLASSPTDAAKQVAMAQLVRIARDVARKKTWEELEQHVFVTIVQAIARSIGIRLTKAKLAQVIPVTGAVIGGGFNVYYTTKVCDAAFFLYRERLLAHKYGPDIIEATVNPSDDFNPDYSDDSDYSDE